LSSFLALASDPAVALRLLVGGKTMKYSLIFALLAGCSKATTPDPVAVVDATFEVDSDAADAVDAADAATAADDVTLTFDVTSLVD
jgi:hypothetical protein